MKTLRLWLTPGIGVKRFVSLALLGGLALMVGAVGFTLWLFGEERSAISNPIEEYLTSPQWYMSGAWLSVGLMVAGVGVAGLAIVKLNRSLLSNWMPHPGEVARILNRKVQLAKGPHIVALGGGSGLSNLLRGLRAYTSNLTAVVAVSDEGGSSGRLRDAYDMPAPGDLTDCLAALSDNESELARLLQYRFSEGNELEGHTFGNLLIATLTQVEGDFTQALRVVNKLLNIAGSVYPATAQGVKLVATKKGGVEVFGEHLMRETPGAVEAVQIEPAAPLGLKEVSRALVAADLIVLGPGSLFSSTLPPMLVPSVQEALNLSSAKLVYVVNIMTEVGETDDFDAFEHVAALVRHGVRKPDLVLVNSAPVDRLRLSKYRTEGADLVAVEEEKFAEAGIELRGIPLIGGGEYAQHDPAVLASALVEIAMSHAAESSGGTQGAGAALR